MLEQDIRCPGNKPRASTAKPCSLLYVTGVSPVSVDVWG